MKKTFFTVISILLISVLAFCGLSSCKKKQSEYVSFTLKMKGDTFKILQLTDAHFINATKTNKNLAKDYSVRDDWAMTAIRAIIEAADPDLIVMTGDTTFTLDTISNLYTRSNDNYEAFKKCADFIDGFDTPWLFCFGNHDEEGSLRTRMGSAEGAKQVLADYLKSDEIKNCLFADGPKEINGIGNYIVNVLNKDGSLNTSLVLFDSGSYLTMVDEDGAYYSDQQKYEYVHDDQLDWYEKAIGDISAIEGRTAPSIIFQHIPMPEYKTAFDSYVAALEAEGKTWEEIEEAGAEYVVHTASGDITYHFGICDEPEHDICCSYVGNLWGKYYDGGHEFARIQKLGSTKYVFCGHDHRNTFSLTYQGVRLTYGMSIDYSANGIVTPPAAYGQTIYDDTVQRGGTLITLGKEGAVALSQVPYTVNLYREALEEKGK